MLRKLSNGGFLSHLVIEFATSPLQFTYKVCRCVDMLFCLFLIGVESHGGWNQALSHTSHHDLEQNVAPDSLLAGTGCI